MDEERPRTISQSLQSLRAFVVRKIKWFTRVPIGLVFVFICLNPFVPEFTEQISSKLKFADPSLVSIIAVTIFLITLERIIIIEDKVTRGEASPLRTYLRRYEAYSDLSNQLSGRKAEKVDLLQFSGDTARDLLRTVAKHSPKAQVRMLLFDPDTANQFDTDYDHHAGRINGTISAIRLMERDFEKDGFEVNIRHYTAMPSVSAVIVDHNIVSVSWYRMFHEGDIVRLEGHNSATITGSGDSASPLFSLARTQFDKLWNKVEET